MRHAKKSTNRDFRILLQEVPEPDDPPQEEDEEDAEQGCDDDNQVCKGSG